MICNRSVKLCVMRTQMICRKEKSCTLKCYNTRTSSTSCALCTQRRKMREQLRGNTDYYLSRALQMLFIMWMCATVSTCVSWSPTAEVSGHFQFWKESKRNAELPSPKKDFSHWGSCVLKVRFYGALTLMTLFRTSATRRAVVKSLCYNCAVSSWKHCLFDCKSVLYNSTSVNVAQSHKFVLCYISNIFSATLVFKNFKTITIRYLLFSKCLKNSP